VRQLLTILIFLTSAHSFGQATEEFIDSSPLDSVITYIGKAPDFKDNGLIIKFSGDAQLFFNELAKLHTNDVKQSNRTKYTLYIPTTTQPYWVFGSYSVFAKITEKTDYQLIEIHFKAYSNPDNYKMYGAAKEYQLLINKLLKL
jgi:hypothetical protein